MSASAARQKPHRARLEVAHSSKTTKKESGKGVEGRHAVKPKPSPRAHPKTTCGKAVGGRHAVKPDILAEADLLAERTSRDKLQKRIASKKDHWGSVGVVACWARVVADYTRDSEDIELARHLEVALRLMRSRAWIDVENGDVLENASLKRHKERLGLHPDSPFLSSLPVRTREERSRAMKALICKCAEAQELLSRHTGEPERLRHLARIVASRLVGDPAMLGLASYTLSPKRAAWLEGELRKAIAKGGHVAAPHRLAILVLRAVGVQSDKAADWVRVL